MSEDRVELSGCCHDSRLRKPRMNLSVNQCQQAQSNKRIKVDGAIEAVGLRDGHEGHAPKKRKQSRTDLPLAKPKERHHQNEGVI